MRIPVLILLAGFAAACTTLDAVPEDGSDDRFLTDEGKADTGDVVEGSPEALGVLDVATVLAREDLRRAAPDGVGLATSTVNAILTYRAGADGRLDTADDRSFTSLAELDAVPHVGAVAFAKLLAFARERGYVYGDDADDVILADLERRYGKPFEQLTEEEYQGFLGTVDLGAPAGLKTWSVVTGIPMVALTKGSDFFYYNAHLVVGGDQLSYEQYSDFSGTYDAATQTLTITSPAGEPQPLVTIPPGGIYPVGRQGAVAFAQGFAADRLVPELLAPYQVRLARVPNRPAIGEGLRSMPLRMVKALRGKGIFFSLESGRSYAVSMPVSNSIYPLFAGLMPGLFLERRATSQTADTLVHEACHVLDHVVIQGHYTIYYPYQFLELQKLAPEQARRFVLQEDTSHGYISWYATTNEQEDFAEHCRAYVRDRADFAVRAASEARDGFPLLGEKLAFLTTMFATDPGYRRLTQAMVDELSPPSGGGGAGGPTPCSGPECEQRCLAAVASFPAEPVLEEILAVEVACAVSDPRRVEYETDYYYVGTVRCTLAADPTPEAVASFAEAIASRGYHSLALVLEDGHYVVAGQTSTRLCSSY